VPGEYRPDYDWEHPFEAELYDMLESNPELREVNTLIPREIPRADASGLVDGNPMVWPPKFSGSRDARTRGAFSEEEKTRQAALYAELFDELVHDRMPDELRRPLPAALVPEQQAAWTRFREGGSSSCEETDVGGFTVNCPGL
jgi:hypothetical protein